VDRALNLARNRAVVPGVVLGHGAKAYDIKRHKGGGSTSALPRKCIAPLPHFCTEANQQKQLNPVGAEGLTGEEYLRTLPQGQQDVIKAIAQGRETRLPVNCKTKTETQLRWP
jgi:hypothetical protein